MRTRRSQSSSDPMLSGLSGQGHRSVLLHEAIEQLAIVPHDTVVDATLGGAGHARAIAGQLGPDGTLVGFDLDADALLRAKNALQGVSPALHILEANFRDMESELGKLGIQSISKALFDLGWSSYQLDSGRGFSFLSNEPLLMTYVKEPGGGLTARTIVNDWQESSLADVIYGWGDERYARRIAKKIVERRERRPIETAAELADIVKSAVPSHYRFGRIHPATRTFQALRIAVNDELGALTAGLQGAWNLLEAGGRIAVITFHSIEDRMVKQLFAAWEKEGKGRRITRKPLAPSKAELARNPRARSAKLRVIERNAYDAQKNINTGSGTSA